MAEIEECKSETLYVVTDWNRRKPKDYPPLTWDNAQALRRELLTKGTVTSIKRYDPTTDVPRKKHFNIIRWRK